MPTAQVADEGRPQMLTQGTFPSSGEAVAYWIETLRRGAVRNLWAVLDDDLRLAVAQKYILRVVGGPDDAMAAELAARDSGHPHFGRMVGGEVRRWRQTHGALADPVAYPYQHARVGSCLEVLVVHGRRQSDVAEPCLFITRFGRECGWCVAATCERLPLPGWPPTDWIIPQLRTAQ